MEKSPEAMRTISEVADDLDVPQHVIRFWETRFHQIHPLKRAGGRRYYRPEDLQTLRAIRHLLYAEGYTIRGVQKLFKEQGLKPFLGGGAGGEPTAHVAALAVEDVVADAPARAPAPAGRRAPAPTPPHAEASSDPDTPAPRAVPAAPAADPRRRAAIERALAELDAAARLLGAA
ncbi:MAG: MerR family transcriptional regulator [Hyphomicrobiales bacterium]|nr:MerR family transcriptional regulator [Hyphomicrobiales bacterium]MDE2017371.1 MerR family transcriptional regulator [Hyphomicrobiales bacterium]